MRCRRVLRHLGDQNAVGVEQIIRIWPEAVGLEHPRLQRRVLAAMHLPPGQQRLAEFRRYRIEITRIDASLVAHQTIIKGVAS